MNPFVIRHSSFVIRNRRGLSLLEVILALAILGVALAMIGECLRLGTRAAQASRDNTEAQLLCESKMSEIASGVELPESVSEAPLDELGEWLYSVEAQAVDEQGLLAVRVTTWRADARLDGERPFQLTRWIVDPNVELAAREAEALMDEEIKARTSAAASGTAGATQTDTSTDPNAANSATTPMDPMSGGNNDAGGRGGRGGRGDTPQLPPGIKLPPGVELPPGFDPSQLPPNFDPRTIDPRQFPNFPGGGGPRGGGR